MTYEGDLFVESGRDYTAITAVTGRVLARGDVAAVLPACTAVGGAVAAYDTARVSLPACTTVGGWVTAYDTARVSLPACTTVGGAVDAYNSARLVLPACTTVGGWVWAYGTARVSLPACTAVGGAVWASDSARMSLPRLRSQQDLAAVRRALARRRLTLDDGILCRIVQRRGHVTRVRRIGQTTISYMVTDGTHTAHGATLAEARADLRLKQSDRDTTPYQGWTPATVVSRADAIAAYRAVTGACGEGVRQWLAGRSIPSRLPVSRILAETVGAYGHETFRQFVMGRTR